MFHNMQRKDKIYISIIAGLVVIIAGLLIVFNVTKNIRHDDSATNSTNVLNNTNDAINDNNVYDKADDVNKAGIYEENAAKYAIAEFTISNTWESGERKYAQVDIAVKNTYDSQIDGWTLTIPTSKDTRIEQNWNCNIENTQDNESISITPVQYNKVIAVDDKTQGIGLIASTDDIKNISENIAGYELTLDINGVQRVYKPDKTGISHDDIDDIKEDTISYENNRGNESDIDYKNNIENDIAEDSNRHGNAAGESITDYTKNAVGRLHVEGTHLVDESGNYVWLRGVSTHGLAWYPQYVNMDAFRTLRDEWNVNVVRLAMYTEEYGGYCNGGDKDALKELIDKGVRYASELGMYVIIDWHILSDSNPYQNKDEAVSFFSEMAEKYAGSDNVLYEICNEPQNSEWNSVIKPYAVDIISCIRQYDSDAVIIVGTNTWSQDVDAVIGNQIDDDNVMYALHFYAGTHKEWIRNKLVAALDAGVAVFISECSICDASGNGGIDYDSAEEWMNLISSRGVSVIAWSLSNKNETSALISPSCDKTGDWSDDDLSETGKWFRNVFNNAG